MMTNMTRTTASSIPVQKVVVVNGNADVLGVMETMLDGGRCDMVFVETSDRAYSRIRAIRPDQVILCAHINSPHIFQLLTMLKLDPDTRRIPVLTFTTEQDEDGDEDSASQPFEDDDEMVSVRPALRMN